MVVVNRLGMMLKSGKENNDGDGNQNHNSYNSDGDGDNIGIEFKVLVLLGALSTAYMYRQYCDIKWCVHTISNAPIEIQCNVNKEAEGTVGYIYPFSNFRIASKT